MAAPSARRAASVPSTNVPGTPASPIPRTTPAASSPATPTHSGRRFRSASRRPGGSACLLVLVAVWIVVGVAGCAFLDLGIIEDNTKHACLGLLELPLDAPLGGLVL